MRHMGNSGKFAVVTGIVAAGLLVLTGMTLALPVFVAFAGVLALAYLSCVAELIVRRRHVMLVLGGVCTSLAVAGTLAFLGTWELSFEDQSSLIGTPLPTSDPDTYFILAAGSLVAAFAVLFTGAVWPGGVAAGRSPARRTPAGRRPQPGQRTSRPRGSQPRATAGGRAPVRQSPSGASRQTAAAKGAAKPGSAGKPASATKTGGAAKGAPKQTPSRQPARKPAPRR